MTLALISMERSAEQSEGNRSLEYHESSTNFVSCINPRYSFKLKQQPDKSYVSIDVMIGGSKIIRDEIDGKFRNIHFNNGTFDPAMLSDVDITDISRVKDGMVITYDKKIQDQRKRERIYRRKFDLQNINGLSTRPLLHKLTSFSNRRLLSI